MPHKKNKNKKKHYQPQSPNSATKEEEVSQELAEELKHLNLNNSNAPFTIAISEVYGRYLIAKRDLKPGEILITERPLAVGPCVSADPVCLGCYMPVTLNDSQYRCPSCRWPLCGADCRGLHQLQGHSNYECDFMKSLNTAEPLTTSSSPDKIKNLYELVLIVRILLMKQHSPDLYDRIMLMESHLEMRRNNPELWSHYESNVVTYLRDKWQMADQFSAEEIHRICGILDVNCFEIGQNFAKARTLYPSAFLLAHDCCPNTSHTDDPKTYDIILRTSRAVKKGESLTLSYAYTLQGTLKRRDFMQAGKLFWCTCKRCADPYELGTDCSAIKCMACKKGLIRATKPLDQEAEWKCYSCSHILLASEVVKILDKINNDLESIDVHNVPGLENFLKRYSDVLGPNHYLLHSAKYSLCQIYGKIENYLLPQLSLEDLQRKQRYCREFLEVIDVLEPGLTRLRGLIMYELHAPIIMISQYLLMHDLITRKQFNLNMKEVVHLLKQSALILKMEPQGSSEHQMGLAAEDALQKMGVN
ncbi:SET and MYND domain containing, arthropod-specific, member 4 [Cochliomyia hominivorax]